MVDFMVQMVPEGVTRETVTNTLAEVGFDDDRMKATIQSLSGGWRMKLAIARAMLWDAEVLLLDEPTNHLDTGAIAWLSNYLKSLTKTTICLVSHDYDFPRRTCSPTSIHLHDKNLTYCPMGFRDFQSLKPEIVAALPSPDNAINKVASVGGNLAAAGGSSASLTAGEGENLEQRPSTPLTPSAKTSPRTLNRSDSRIRDLEGEIALKCVMYMKDVSFNVPRRPETDLAGQ